MRYSTILLALLLCAGPLRSSPARAADETSAAREHAQKGKAFMDLGKYTEAAAEYEDAYASKPDPALLLNLAQAYRLAGNTDKALFFYRKYLQHVPKSPYRADIEEKIAALEKSGAAGPAGGDRTPRAGATSPPPPAGDTSNAPPGPTSVPPAPPPLTGTAPPAAPPAADTYGGAPGVPATNPPGAMPPPGQTLGGGPAPAAAPVDHGKSLRLAGIATGGAAVLSFVIAAVYGAQAKDAAKNIEKVAASGGTFDPSEDSRGRSAQTREGAFVIIGVAALAGGGVLYYLGARHPASETAPPPGGVAVSLFPAASRDRLGAALRVTF